MGSSNTSLIIGIVVGFLATLGIAYALIYATAMFSLPLSGPGLIPPAIVANFPIATIQNQLYMVYNDVILNILIVYILAPVIWLIGGLIAGLVVRDMMKGAAAGANGALLLTWVLNGLLAGLIAAVGGVIGGTLTSQFEAH